MELKEYQEKAYSTCMKSSANYAYMSEGLDGEVGEYKGKVAKLIRKGKAKISNNFLILLAAKTERPEILNELKKELGDILWFVAGMATVMNWSLEDVAAQNLEKLADRQKRNVIDGNGDNR